MSKLVNKKWTTPINLEEINTEKEELSPFIHTDDQTLYFTSNGWPGMGRLDLFMTQKKENGTFATPSNLGYPINSPQDEYSLMIDKNGKTGYFSAKIPGDNYGDLDIYSFELPREKSAKQTAYLKGTIKNEEGQVITNAQLSVFDTNNSKPLIVDVEEGNYLTPLVTDKRYGLQVICQGYVMYSESFDFSPDSKMEIEKDIVLKKIKKDTKIELKNIYFESGKSELKKESFTELDKLLLFLNTNPEIKIQIEGHTDSVGSEKANLELSTKRASNIYEYLIGKGGNKNNISYKGLGESEPVAPNDTEEGRAKNRRTQVKIL